MSRRQLPNRRKGINRRIAHQGIPFEVNIGFYEDDKPGEVFLSMDKMGTPLENFARDAAIAVSLALQFGCPADILSKAFLRDEDGTPATILGLVMDMVSEEKSETSEH